ncbi:CcoQ/FixQ family Cbb3-type cytochrome c oxidase assembly chaperone [Pseudomonas sp. Sample_24]|uniref:cbb3-type cytochrome oxidase subunit 3 n=1 Tax=Pseudomonas sp. Sample_24 TaxID=2448268 RepID=UPI001032B405|nr:CcoQ/FixQ family Cbb3-type cytochrome c oxidase assembly chaperone [Pseudomonas sp. Sample_24]
MVVELSTGMIRGLGTVVVFVAFLGLTLWVFSSKRKTEFAEARLLPFADELQPDITDEIETRSTRP